MKITRNDNKFVDFGTISKGTVFKDTSDVIYIALDLITRREKGADTPINAVDLETGELAWFFADEQVCPLSAELIVS